MKDIQFTSKQQKLELWWLCCCFAAAFILNAVSIVIYRTEWKELWTQIIWVVFIGAGFYVLSVFVRLIIGGAKRLLKK
jgi:hypothetical protein